MEFLRQLLSGIVQAWRRLGVSARVNLALAAVLTFGVIAAGVIMANRPEYVRLYDRVDPKEMSQIVDLLSQEKVPYKVSDSDQTILVPLDSRSRMKMLLASKGLPTSQGTTPGFESLKGQDLVTNTWMRDMNYMRAVQGELQRQLNEFDFINRSLVFIREAKEELFSAQQKPSEAAVTIDVKRALSKNEIKAILHTVSSFGGANLSTDNITLVTTEGTPLHLPPSSDFASIANSKLEYIAELEKQREDRVTHDLERLGVRALVKVSATVDFDSTTETSNKKEEGAVISSYSTTTSNSNKELATGAPGTSANLPEGASATAKPENNEKTEETIDNFEPSSTETTTTKSPGKVKQFVVSAIIEGETQKTTDASGKETTEYTGLTPEKKKMYEDFIRAAVGEGETPTKISINDQAFSLAKLNPVEAARTMPTSPAWNLLQDNLWKAVQVLLVLAGFWFVRRLLRNAIITSPRDEEPVRELATASPEDMRREEVANEVARMSQENPEAVVALLRSWIAQDEE